MFRILFVWLAAMLWADVGARSEPDTVVEVADSLVVLEADTVAVIVNPADPAPDDIYAGEETVVSDTVAVALADYDKFPVVEMATSAGVFAVSALFVSTPPFEQWRKEVQKHLSQHGAHKTEVDNYIQYAPLVAPFALYACGMKGEHRLLDKVILSGLSYATFAVLNQIGKNAFREKRPDSNARNSFPSGHTGTVVTGAEILRREYWNTNKWVAMSGYVVAAAVGYLRIHNDRHWINDVVGGAALGYLSTTFAYWIYPKLFRKRAAIHRRDLLIRQQKQRRPGEMVMATPFATGTGAGVAVSYTF